MYLVYPGLVAFAGVRSPRRVLLSNHGNRNLGVSALLRVSRSVCGGVGVFDVPGAGRLRGGSIPPLGGFESGFRGLAGSCCRWRSHASSLHRCATFVHCVVLIEEAESFRLRTTASREMSEPERRSARPVARPQRLEFPGHAAPAPRERAPRAAAGDERPPPAPPPTNGDAAPVAAPRTILGKRMPRRPSLVCFETFLPPTSHGVPQQRHAPCHGASAPAQAPSSR